MKSKKESAGLGDFAAALAFATVLALATLIARVASPLPFAGIEAFAVVFCGSRVGSAGPSCGAGTAPDVGDGSGDQSCHGRGND
jgi:hypothetical protein